MSQTHDVEKPVLPDRPIIAVVGAGAVGAYYGGRLAQHGHEVHFLLRGDYDAVRADGWTIRSCHGDFVLKPDQIHLHCRPQDMPEADLVLVALKTTANDQYEPLIAPLVHEKTTILTLQNGLGNEERLAGLFGARKIVGGMAFVCINRIGPGEIHHLAEGLIKIGEFTGPAGGRIQKLATMFGTCGVECRVLQDLRWGRWEKLIWNIPFNGLSAALNRTTDILIEERQGEALVRALMEEVIAGAAAIGVSLPAKLIDYKVDQTKAMGAYKTSMHLDMQAGRPMEVEAIIGEPLRQAQAAGCQAPRLQMLYQLLKIKDARLLPEVL